MTKRQAVTRGEMADSYYPDARDRLWDTSEIVLDDLIERGEDRLRVTLLELMAAEMALGELRFMRIWDNLRGAGVRCAGEAIIVDYKNGSEAAILDYVEKELPNNICIRHLTKKGKPMMHLCRLPCSMAKFIRPKPKES